MGVALDIIVASRPPKSSPLGDARAVGMIILAELIPAAYQSADGQRESVLCAILVTIVQTAETKTDKRRAEKTTPR